MATVMRNLWPEDITSEDVISPEEILQFQADQLESRTNGILAGHVVKLAHEDRIVIGFEVEAPRAQSRVRLFEVQHRPDFEYPVAIIPPREELPEFLKDRVYRAGLRDVATVLTPAQLKGEWVENKWVASSPAEFTEKVKELLGRAAVKAIVLSLIARSNRADSANGENASSDNDKGDSK